MTCSWLQCTCHGSVLFIIHVLQCTCAQSPWLWFIHYTCATVYMCSASMTVVYSLYMCYSVHVFSLRDCGLFIIHVLQCTCAQWFIHYTCATVYMCSVSMTVVYSLYMCYSVHVLSLHDCGLFIIHVLQCTCATVYMCSASMAVFYSLCLVSMGGMTVTDKPYQCSVCERAFIRKQDIDRHRCVTTR